MLGSLVVDSGPLMTFVALCHLDQTEAPKGKRDAIFRELRDVANFTASQQERLRRALDKPVLTTPHVLAEVFKFREISSLYKDQEKLRTLCLDLLASGGIEEVSCPIAELERDTRFRQLACRFGLTDAGLVFVAEMKKAVLLTDDMRLFRTYSSSAKYEIRLLDDYLRA